MNRKKMTLFNYVNGVFLLLLVIVCILPILHVIALSLSERIEAVAGNVTFYPIGFTLEAYRYVMEDSQFWTSLRVTLTRVLIGVPANILLVVMTAYPLSKANSRFHLLLLAVRHHHAVRRRHHPHLHRYQQAGFDEHYLGADPAWSHERKLHDLDHELFPRHPDRN